MVGSPKPPGLPRGRPRTRRPAKPAVPLPPGELPPPLSEAELQALWVEYLRVALPDGAVHHHSPNEGRRGWRAQAALKANGTLAGMPDSMVLWGGRVFFLELKMPGRRPGPAQVACHAALRRAGFPVAVCTTLEELAARLAGWGVPLRVGLGEWKRHRAAPRLTAAQYRAGLAGR